MKFKNNPDYLFFMGVIGHIAEYYWGEKNDDFATAMSLKAAELEPNNLLFEWAALSPISSQESCERKAYLAQFILKDSTERRWLESKGLPGKYILNTQVKGSSMLRCMPEGVLLSGDTRDPIIRYKIYNENERN